MSDLVPEGWSYDLLGDYISESVAGEWGIEATGDANDIPVLRSTNFTASGIIDYSKLAYRNIDERKRLAKSLKFGDIVLEKSGGSPTQPVGRVVYFDKYKPFLFSNFTQKLSPVDTCDSKFLFYKLYSEYQNGTVLKFQQQTTGIINFQLAEYLGYKSAFPPLPEQQKIATILSSVDEVIEKTRAQIDKLKDLKTGMMQELLTKGIGHTEFKDSPVGRIPAEWTVKKLDDLSEKISDGIHTTPKYVEKSEYHFINGNNLQDGQIVIGDKTKCVPESEFIKLKRDLTDNTILMSINGTIGKLAFYAGEQVVLGKSAAFISLAKEQSKKFIFYVLQSQATTQFYDFELTGSTIKNLSLRTIKQTPVPIPTKKEQALIVSILSENDKKIRLKTELLNQVEALKKALMQDLLTGKVRVTPDEPAAR